MLYTNNNSHTQTILLLYAQIHSITNVRCADLATDSEMLELPPSPVAIVDVNSCLKFARFPFVSLVCLNAEFFSSILAVT